jgi:phenylacetate-CoA ligase
MHEHRYDRPDRAEALIGPNLVRQETPLDHRKLRRAYDARFRAMTEFRFLPLPQIRDWQLRRIREIVSHAHATVPLYREKYSAAGFEPGDLQSWDDFYRLPLLTKDELIAAWPDGSISSEHDAEFMTMSSGSSGRFVYLAVDEDAVHFENLQMARQNHVQSGGRLGPEDLTLFIITCPWWFTSTDGLYPQDFLTTRVPFAAAYEAIRTRRPAVISAYPSYLSQLAAAYPDLGRHGLRLIIVHSEGSSSAERRALAECIGVDIRDEYSSEELIRMALECPHGRYHVEADACHLEILEPRTGRRLAAGEMGEVVGTNLVNRATPFIRYRQGDLSSLLPACACPCGSSFPGMTAPRGRIDDSFVRADGTVVPAGVLIDDAYNWVLESRIPVNGMQYQIVQRDIDQVEVFLVVRGDFTDGMRAAARQTIERRLRDILGQETTVDTRLVDAIPHRNGAKTKAVLSLLSRAREVA